MTARRFVYLLCFCVIIIPSLAACAAVPTSVPTATAAAPTAPVSSAPTLVQPQFSSETGALKVTFISSFTGKPLADALIRCAVLLKMQGSMEGVYVPSLDSKSSPWGVTDVTGTVVISNIKPGKYSFAYIFPIGMPELVKLDGSDKDYTVDVPAGKLLDLGTLKVAVNPDKLN
jgi:hypothetical protein